MGRLRSASHLRLCSSPTLPKGAATRLRKRPEAARLTLSRSKTGSSCSRPCTSPDRRATRRVGSYITYSTAVTWVAAGLSVLRNGRVSSIGSAALLLTALECIVPIITGVSCVVVCVCVCDVVRDTVESTPAVCTHGRLSTAHARSCSDVNLFFRVGSLT